MSKRARSDLPYEAHVIDPETNEHVDTVVPGGLLSRDVPARLRDSLLATNDWTEVADPSGSSNKEEK